MTSPPITPAYHPHLKQARVLETAKRVPYTLSLGGLQSGKTHNGAFWGLTTTADAGYRLARDGGPRDAIFLAVSPTVEMGRDVLQAAYRRHLSAEPWLNDLLLGAGNVWDDCFLKSENTLVCRGLPWPIDIKFRSATDGVERLRGLTNVVGVHIDEGSAIVKDGDGVWNMCKNRVAVMQGITKGALGHIVVTTTPLGFDWTYDAIELPARNYPDLYACIRMTCWDNPHRSKRELDDLLATTPQWMIDQQLLALRVTSATSAFPGIRDHVWTDRLVARLTYKRPHDLRWDAIAGWEPVPVVTGVDLAMTGAYMTFVTREVDAPHNLVAFRRYHPHDLELGLQDLEMWHQQYGGSIFADQTGMGEMFCSRAKRRGLPLRGVKINEGNRRDMLHNKALLMAGGNLPQPAEEVWLREHEAFGPQTQEGRLDHPPGQYDDLVFGDALCVRGLMRGRGASLVMTTA